MKRLTPYWFLLKTGFGVAIGSCPYRPQRRLVVSFGRTVFTLPKDPWFCRSLDPWYERWFRVRKPLV